MCYDATRKQDCKWQDNFWKDHPITRRRYWDNKQARSPFLNFPINDPVKTGKAPTGLSNSRVQFNWAAIILATWLDTPPVEDVALFSYKMSLLKLSRTSISS